MKESKKRFLFVYIAHGAEEAFMSVNQRLVNPLTDQLLKRSFI